jgi:hypothetical protein
MGDVINKSHYPGKFLLGSYKILVGQLTHVMRPDVNSWHMNGTLCVRACVCVTIYRAMVSLSFSWMLSSGELK